MRDAATIRSTLMYASAGAGKTHILAERLFALLSRGEHNIVAITFTRAAAAEMATRILDTIEKDAELSRDEKLACLFRSGRTLISTFDAFFYLLLSGQEDVADIADERAIAQLTAEATEHFYEMVERSGELEELFMAARLLRKSMSAVVDEFLEDAQNIRFQKNRLSDDALKKEVGKMRRIHEGSLQTGREIAEYGAMVTDRVKTSVVDVYSKNIEQWGKTVLGEADIADWSYLGKKIDWAASPYREIRDIAARQRELYRQYVTTRLTLREALLTRLHRLWEELFDAIKKHRGVMSFADISRRLIALDGRDTDARPELENAFWRQGLWRTAHLLADEFQDTASDQMTLIDPLIAEILSVVDDRGMGARSFFAVGDWKQMVYRWRGADRGAVERVLSPYIGSRIQEDHEKLTENWRSTPLLVAYFNALSSRLFPENERGVQKMPPKKSGTYDGWSGAAWRAVKSAGRSNDALFEAVIEEVRALRDRGVPCGDIAVLCRSNTHKQEVARLLSECGIGSSEIRGRQLLAAPEGLLAWLSLASVFSEEKDPFLEAALDASGLNGTEREHIRSLKGHIRGRFPQPFRYSAVCAVLSALPAAVRPVVCDILRDETESFFRDGGADAAAFVSYLFSARQEITIPEPPHGELVRLATIHYTKGLQFPHVIVLLPPSTDNKGTTFFHDPAAGHVTMFKKDADILRSFGDPTTRRLIEGYDAARQIAAIEDADLLYVAATRAAKSVAVIVDADDERTALVNGAAAIEDMANAGEFVRGAARAAAEGRVSWEKTYIAARSLKADERGHRELPEPMELVHFAGKETTDTIDRAFLSSALGEGIDRGLQMHEALASVRAPEDRPADGAMGKSDHDTLTRFLADGKVRAILFRPGSLYIEQSISDTIETGRVDRLIVAEDRVTLIDYKTGPRRADLMEKYREQMERYRKMLRNIYADGRPTECFLLFVDEKDPVTML